MNIKQTVLLSSEMNCKRTQFNRSLQRKWNYYVDTMWTLRPSVHPSVHLPVGDANIISD